VGSWELDVATGESQWTYTLYRLIGLEPGTSSPTFDDILAVTHPDDRALLQQTLQTTVAEGVAYELEHRMTGPDGTLRYRVSRGEPIFNDRGEVVRVIGTITDITARKQIELKLLQLQAQLQIQAQVDSLTQVANRYQLDTVLGQEWRRCQRSQEPIAVFMIDIDHFKAYNDRYGHLQGDRCLQQVAQILQRCVNRASDLVARYGGEEFTLVLPQTDAHGSIQIAEQIQQEVQRANIPHEGAKASDRLTLSLGIVIVTRMTHTSPYEALRMADQALYEAKQHRNCFRITQI
jgi:diguanylate cyclase (GGDEF)-like protein